MCRQRALARRVETGRGSGACRPSECELQCVSAATKRGQRARSRRGDGVLQVRAQPQRCAAAEFADLKDENPSGLQLLHGPPGTGKTTTIVALLQALHCSFLEIDMCTASGLVADEGGESPEDGGAQCESEDTSLSLVGQQKKSKGTAGKKRRKITKFVIPASPY